MHFPVPNPLPRARRSHRARQGRLLLDRVCQHRHVRRQGDHQRVFPPRGDCQGPAGGSQERRQARDGFVRRARLGRRGSDRLRQQQGRQGDRLCLRVSDDDRVVIVRQIVVMLQHICDIC